MNINKIMFLKKYKFYYSVLPFRFLFAKNLNKTFPIAAIKFPSNSLKISILYLKDLLASSIIESAIF